MLGLQKNSMANRSGTKKGPAVGDVVIVKDPPTATCFWKLATVEELIKSKDGNFRAASVKTTSQTRKPQLLKRAIQHLIPVEI